GPRPPLTAAHARPRRGRDAAAVGVLGAAGQGRGNTTGVSPPPPSVTVRSGGEFQKYSPLTSRDHEPSRKTPTWVLRVTPHGPATGMSLGKPKLARTSADVLKAPSPSRSRDQ